MTADVAAPSAGRSALFGKVPWWGLAVEGVLLIILGLIAAAAPLAAGFAATLVIGWVFVIGGVIRAISSLRHRGPGWVWSLVSGIIAIVAGVLLLGLPLAGLLTLTIVVGAYFLVHALMSFFLAFSMGRYAGRTVWLVVGGIADLILGLAIYWLLPVGAFWILGLLVGINLAFAGASLLAVSLSARAQAAG